MSHLKPADRIGWLLDVVTDQLQTDEAVLALHDPEFRRFHVVRAGRDGAGPDTEFAASDQTLCDGVVQTGKMQEINALNTDANTCSLMRRLNTQSYLGAPVRGWGGAPVASLAALSVQPRIWSVKNRHDLGQFANLVEDILTQSSAPNPHDIVDLFPVSNP